MEEKNNTKVDLVVSILEVVKNKEKVDITSNLNDAQIGPLYTYYFKENIQSIFGRTEFAPDEFDIMSTKDSIIIENIFGQPLTIHFLNNQLGPKIVGEVDSKEVFRIEQSNNTLVNRVMDASGTLTVYKSDADSNDYTLYRGETSNFEIDENELSSIAKLSNLKTKIKDYETFELTRIKPPVEKSGSFLKRIIDNNVSYVKIPTSSELVNVSLYADLIFDKIKYVMIQDGIKKNRNN